MKRWFSIFCMIALLASGISVLSLPATAQVPGGKIAFVSSRDVNSQIYVMNADGSNQVRLSTNPAQPVHNDFQPSFSHDGSKIVFASIRAGNAAIYTMNADGTNEVRLTNSLQQDEMPSFSPDGTKIVFISDRTGVFEVFIMNADGTNQTQLTSNPSTPGFLQGDYAPAFSPDGTKILFESYHNNSYYDIDEMNMDGSGKVLLAHIAGDGFRPSFSPDGSRIVFGGSNFTQEVDVMNVDGTGRTTLATGGYNANPVFSPDGSQIAFTSDRSQPATTTAAGDQEIYIMNADGSNWL